ncbi:MAG: hypothetical protein AB2A00_22560 [Myxococcota bacterium]
MVLVRGDSSRSPPWRKFAATREEGLALLAERKKQVLARPR